jgi:hypothetical protein
MKNPPLTPFQRKLRADPAEVALLRTTVRFGQTAAARQDAMQRLAALGLDPTRKVDHNRAQ